MHRKGQPNAYLFIAFPLTVLFLFTLIPTIVGLGLSLFTWDGGGWPTFIGLRNFHDLFQDPRFTPALINTLAFVVGTVPVTVLTAFILAVAVDAAWFRGKVLVRTMFFMPTIVSIVAVGFVWRWLLYNQGGLIPSMLRTVGVSHPPDFLNGGAIISLGGGGVALLTWPMLAIIFVQVWRGIGFCLVLYLAALAGVNRNLYEAAEVDGASRWRIVRHITWPQVRPMTAFLLITGVIGALQVFDIVWTMTGSTESDATNVLNLYIYREFKQGRLGYAAAIGVVIFTLTVLATALQLIYVRRRSA